MTLENKTEIPNDINKLNEFVTTKIAKLQESYKNVLVQKSKYYNKLDSKNCNVSLEFVNKRIKLVVNINYTFTIQIVFFHLILTFYCKFC